MTRIESLTTPGALNEMLSPMVNSTGDLISFMHPNRLWLLLLVPAIWALFVVGARRYRAKKSGASAAIAKLLGGKYPWKKRVAVLASLISVAALVVAFAQPQMMAKQPRQRATVVLAIDISRSMMATDVEPNRLQAAQEAASEFVSQIPEGFNVSLVTFAGNANAVVPPTLDHAAVIRAINNIELGPSTAIGEGIYVSLYQLKLVPEDPKHPGEPVPAAIVLLSDGETNSGRSSATAAKAARQLSVPVYTISFGTRSGYVVEDGKKNYVPVNEKELENVAVQSGGQAYSADSLSSLKKVYQDINSSVAYEKVKQEATDTFAGVALIAAVVAVLATMSLSVRWP